MTSLQTNLLTKDFGLGKGAFGIDINVLPGQIVGFIGPNGAGKSTTLNMCSGFVRPDSGTIKIFDQLVNHLNIHQIYPKIGLLLSEANFDKNLTPQDIFTENEALYGKPCKPIWSELAHLLEVDLKKPFGSLSLGNRKKIGIVNSLMHSPELIIMDEPTNGLDPLVQQKFLKYLQDMAKNGSAILLSSHVLSEVQMFCQQIYMIKAGKIILHDTTENILGKASRLFRVKYTNKAFIEKIEISKLASKIETTPSEVLIYTNEYEKMLKLFMENLIYDFFLERPSLEKMFLELY